MVQAVHVENLTEGSEWRRGQRWHGNQSFECVRKNRKAEKNGSVRQEPDRKRRERPATTGADEPPHSTRVSTTPAADCCCRIRMNYSTLSPESETCSSSPEISSIAFHAQPPNLRFASLIDMGFATIGPLARRSRLRSGSSTLARAFAPRFLQTPPHGDALALRYHFTSIRL